MTQHHCDHECVCPDYKASHSDWEEDPDPCTMSCYHRSHPHTPTPIAPTRINEISPVYPEEWLKQHDATTRNQTLEPVIETLSDLNRYSCQEFEEANLSDNEREMRIHLEYGNRLWGIIRSLRSTTAQQQEEQR